MILGSFIVGKRKETAELKTLEPSSLPAEPSGGASSEQVHAVEEHVGGQEDLSVLQWP